MSAYRTPPPVPLAAPRSWLHRVAHMLGIHACTCEAVYVEDVDRLVVYLVCATCGRREVLASRDRWAGGYFVIERRHPLGPIPSAFATASVASTLESLDDMKRQHAELTEACHRLDRKLGDIIAAGR